MKSGDGVRRCRVLLGHPKRTALDFRLLAQVEVRGVLLRGSLLKFADGEAGVKLNSIRGKLRRAAT